MSIKCLPNECSCSVCSSRERDMKMAWVLALNQVLGPGRDIARTRRNKYSHYIVHCTSTVQLVYSRATIVASRYKTNKRQYSIASRNGECKFISRKDAYIHVRTRGVNRAEISGPARKFFSARPGPQLIYYKICTMV